MRLFTLVCSATMLLCTVGSDATLRQLTPGESHTLPARLRVALGEPWNATPNSTGALKWLWLRGTRFPPAKGRHRRRPVEIDLSISRDRRAGVAVVRGATRARSFALPALRRSL